MYKQSQPQIAYDFSRENIDRVAYENRAAGITRDTGWGLHAQYAHMASHHDATPDTLNPVQKYDITNELIANVVDKRDDISKHRRQTWISGVSTGVGYALAATSLYLFNTWPESRGGMDTLGAAMGVSMLSFGSLMTSYLNYSVGNFTFKFTREQNKQLENDKEYCRSQDHLNFIVNENDASRCVDKKETLRWAQQFKAKSSLDM